MSNITVTRYTLTFADPGRDHVGAMKDLTMALPTIGLDHIQAILFDLHGLLEIARGKGPGMPDAMDRLGLILAKKIAGGMTAVAI